MDQTVSVENPLVGRQTFFLQKRCLTSHTQRRKITSPNFETVIRYLSWALLICKLVKGRSDKKIKPSKLFGISRLFALQNFNLPFKKQLQSFTQHYSI